MKHTLRSVRYENKVVPYDSWDQSDWRNMFLSKTNVSKTTAAGKCLEVDVSTACFLQKYVWKGELNAGSYYLLPFTSGCKLKRRNKKTISGKAVELINRSDSEEIDLSRELRLV